MIMIITPKRMTHPIMIIGVEREALEASALFSGASVSGADVSEARVSGASVSGTGGWRSSVSRSSGNLVVKVF